MGEIGLVEIMLPGKKVMVEWLAAVPELAPSGGASPNQQLGHLSQGLSSIVHFILARSLIAPYERAGFCECLVEFLLVTVLCAYWLADPATAAHRLEAGDEPSQKAEQCNTLRALRRFHMDSAHLRMQEGTHC